MRDAPWPGAVAVSGGSDSIALMHLLSGWAAALERPPPVVLTVDHGLRDGSDIIAREVVASARRLGLEAHVLRWRDARPEANIEAAAREARYRLLGNWCAQRAIAALYVAHTRDDQAETFLLRLSRGSGLDGLSAMTARGGIPGFETVALMRPLLSVDREDLRALLKAVDGSWHDDPMNGEERFARVRIRNAWPALEAAGLTKTRIADAAAHLGRARAALEQETSRCLESASRPSARGIVLDRLALTRVPLEIGLRALALLLMQATGAPYRPRFERLEALFEALTAPEFHKARTLHGCRIGPAPKGLATFGPSTVLIAPEKPRRTGKSGR